MTIGVELAPLVQVLRGAPLGRRLLDAEEAPVALPRSGHSRTHRAQLRGSRALTLSGSNSPG